MTKHTILPPAIALICAAMLWSQSRGTPERPLPDGPGRDAVQAACTQCHALAMVSNAGHTHDDWVTVVNMMVNDGAKLEQSQIPQIADYLAKNFPEKPLPPAVIVPGPVKVTFKQWTVPTPGSRPHDPLAAADGTIWYTGHMASLLGHIDPATGSIKEFHPKTPNAGPHGLVEDKDGNIWFTENFKAKIGELFPKTGEFKEYDLPAEARDPHTPIFDQKGTLWFTVQGANMVGRLIPATGEIKLVTSPTPKSNPYGMVVNSKGVPFFVEFGAPKVASIDPVTMEIHEYPLPNPDARPRRVAITADDVIWYSDFSRGYLGRLDPKTGKVTEWPSPSGPQSQPYGIAIVHGAVFYCESNTKPNTLTRFDPKTEKFQTWTIPGGGGVVRNMMVTKDGSHLAMAESGVNKVALAEIK